MGRSAGGGFGGGGFSGGGFGGGFSSGGIGGGFTGGGGRSGGGRSGGPGFGGPSGPSYGGYGGYGGGNGFLGGLLLGGLLSDRRGGSMPSGTGPGGGDGNGSGQGPQGSPTPSGSGGCLTTILVVIAAIILCVALMALMDGGACSADTAVTESTVEREPLPAGSVQETPYFTDAAGDWIANPSQLEQAMRQFYMDTGVQPYLYIEPNGSYTSAPGLSQLAQEFYEENIPDQAHFVVFFCDNNQGGFTVGYWIGAQARAVMDSQAIRIFQDCLNANYNNFNLSETEIFANTFVQTADRIMTTDAKRNGPVYITVAVVFGVVVVLIIVAVILRRRQLARAEELRRQEAILSQPLEKFGDEELRDLEKKYSEQNESETQSQ